MMKKHSFLLAISLSLAILCQTGLGVLAAALDTASTDLYTSPNRTTEAEKQRAEAVYRGYLENLATFPVSFKLDSEAHHGFGEAFEKISQTTEIDKDNSKIEKTVTVLRHKASDLVFTVNSDFYPDYAAYEWVVYIKNEGSENSPIISDLYALDTTFDGADPFVHTSYGDAQQFLPDDRAVNGELVYAPRGGRSSEGAFPYFNFEYGGRGMLMAVGWSGQWQVNFNNSANADKTDVKVKQQRFHAYLKDGEEIRTPLVAMVFYDGNDLDRAANLWRHWFIDCSMHRVTNEETGERELMAPGVSGGTSVQFSEMTLATDRNQIEAIRQYIENGIDISYWWMDAGWYYSPGGKTLAAGDWMPTGSWQVDRDRFPSLMADISDYAASVGVNTLLWFEPERVGGSVMNNGNTVDPSWILADYLVNEGNTEARDWLLNRILEVMGNGNISLYREDFNCQPLKAWNSGDTKQGGNRVGITENLYVQGHLYIWDKILEKYPSVMIDSCASGGNRNDFEALRRSVQLHKTDYDYGDSAAQQMYALQMYDWMPFFGTKADTSGATGYADRYFLRTALVSWTVLGYDSNQPIDWDIVRDVIDEHELVNRYNYADYYKLTPYSRSESDPAAWEFYDPEDKSGYALIFRREDAPADTHLRLKGLDPNATYHLWLEDRSTHFVMSGSELMTDGITVTIPAARSSDILHFATEYDPRTLVPSITQVSSNGTWAGAVLENEGYLRFDVRFNMALRGTVFSDKTTVESGVVGDYLDCITVGGRSLREIKEADDTAVYAEYDAVNNILRLKFRADANIISKDSDSTVVIKKELSNHEGIAVGKDVEFTYSAKDSKWYKQGTDVSAIELRTQASSLKVGSRILLTAIVSPEDATYADVTFSVSDTDVATINEYGYLKAKKPGTVTVTATAKDGTGITAITEITVLSDSEEDIPPETTPSTSPDTDNSGAKKKSIPLVPTVIAIVGGIVLATAVIALLCVPQKAKIICACVAVAAAIVIIAALMSFSGSDADESPADTTETAETLPPETTPQKTGEKLLVELEYTDFRLVGSDQPFYHSIPHTGEQFEVAGELFSNGVFINPVDNETPGYVEYDISEFDYDRFAFKFGKLDVAHGAGNSTYAVVYIDGKKVATTPKRSQGDDAVLCDVEIPEGSKELRIECYTSASFHSCSSVIGDARLYYAGTEIEWPQ